MQKTGKFAYIGKYTTGESFRRFHDTTISFPVGLICGSLYSLWPFKKAELIASYYVKEGTAIERIDNYLVYSNINILPADLHTAMLAAAMVCVGMFTMLFFVRREKN